MRIRLGRHSDLPYLLELEAASFEVERRESPTTLRRSLTSPHQEVWLAIENGKALGAIFLRFHKHTARIHSIAVNLCARGTGVGSRLLESAVQRAVHRGCERIHLEADSRNLPFVEWYRRHGFRPVRKLEDYYAPGWGALRMSRKLTEAKRRLPKSVK